MTSLRNPQGAMRSADLTRQLLAFARKQTVSPKVLDLNDTVAGMLKMLRRLIGEDIDLAWLPGHGLWPVKMDPSQIDQILANLRSTPATPLPNGQDHHRDGQHLAWTRAYCADHRGLRPRGICASGGERQRLRHGQGNPAQHLRTLLHHQGTGQGHRPGAGHRVWHRQAEQRLCQRLQRTRPGNHLKIYLPSFATEAVTTETRLAEEPASGTETVLLVEDEVAILTSRQDDPPAPWLYGAHRQHADGGDSVGPGVCRGNPSAHHRCGDARDERPGAGATALCPPPGLQCLYMSGYTADVIAHHGVLEQGTHFIQKPFSMGDLARTIRETIQNNKK